ncbi:hypothetical protein ACFLRT_00715 [Acidobacteriota bacterium]
MQAVREIRRADSETVTVRILEEFRHIEVEIIVLPFSDITSKDQKDDKLAQFDRLVENAKKRNFRIDKSIDIDAIMNEMNNGLY